MKLSIAEGLYLIALDDEEGRLLAAAEKHIVYGLISAGILELYLSKKLAIQDGVIQVVDSQGTGNLFLDKILKKVASGNQLIETIKILHNQFKDISEDLNELLVQRGILKKEETKLLWIPLSERLGNANYAFEQEIRNLLHAVVFKNAKPSPSFIILFALIHHCGILNEVFKDKDEQIDADKMAKDIVDSPVIDGETSAALKKLRKFFSEL